VLVVSTLVEAAMLTKAVPFVTGAKVAPKAYYFEKNTLLRQPMIAMELVRN